MRARLPTGSLGLVEEFRFLRRFTERRAKVSVTGPLSLVKRIRNEHYPTEEALALDIARVMNVELRELVRAGATDIQVDEPYYSGFPEDLPWAVRAVNALVEGVGARLSLHGLWPQPRGNDYCEVPERLVRLDLENRWGALPEVEIDRATRAALAAAMPGTASFLDRHEWIKHGTCYRGAGGAQEYFDDMLGLTEELNDSAVARFLAANQGRQVRAADIEAAFDRAFGRGAGDRVELVCERDGRRTLIVGIHITLGGVIGPETGLARLIQAARPVERSCDRGILDPPGLQ